MLGRLRLQGVAVEKHHRTGRDFDRNGVFVGIREAHGFEGAVEAAIGVPFLIPQNARFVAARNDPQTAVFGCGVVKRDPGAAQGAVARGDVIFVLMPRLAWFARSFDEEHRLHRFDIGADYRG